MKKLSGCPSWLSLTADRTSFVLNSDRAIIVRKIFEMSAGGLGSYSIAKKLNASGIPGFGKSGRWNKSTINNIVHNRATFGDYQKKRRVHGRIVPVGRPISYYYPAVIEEELFQAAQVAQAKNLVSGRGRKGNDIANLFSDLAHCYYCKNPVRYHSDAKSLVCSEVYDGRSCQRFCWSYGDFELTFLALARQNNGTQLSELIDDLGRAQGLEVYATRAELMLALRRNVSNCYIAAAGTTPPEMSVPLRIRRDHPERCFTVVFRDGRQEIGIPRTPLFRPRVETQSRISPELDPTRLISVLGVSPRQAALIASLAGGRSLRQTAENLRIELSTARWHLRTIFERTNTHSQADLIVLSRRTIETI